MINQNKEIKPLEISIVIVNNGKETEGKPTIIENIKLLDSIVGHTVIAATLMNNMAEAENLPTRYYVSLSNGQTFLNSNRNGYEKQKGDYQWNFTNFI